MERKHKRLPLSPSDAADRLALNLDRAEDLLRELDQLASAYYLPRLAAPAALQARRLARHAVNQLQIAIELCERGDG